MGKKLSEMSLKELWQLFPIILTEHQDCWKDWYEEEKSVLKRRIPEAVRISHIGSTAVSTIWAKPIVDILAEVPQGFDMTAVRDSLRDRYICMSQSAGRMSFNRGYTENGFAERVFHLHLRYEKDHDELYFRDYLIEHPDAARAYEDLKRKLWKEFTHDRDGYTDAKKEFVQACTEKAKKEYAGRY